MIIVVVNINTVIRGGKMMDEKNDGNIDVNDNKTTHVSFVLVNE